MRIAFVLAHIGASDLSIASLGIVVTDDARIEIQPAWLPDGRRLAYQAVWGLGPAMGIVTRGW